MERFTANAAVDSVLDYAVRFRNVEIVKVLIAGGPNLRRADQHGHRGTPSLPCFPSLLLPRRPRHRDRDEVGWIR
jgi:hypothetical protein